MSIGFFIWVLVALAILGFAAWSFAVQLKQKEAWRAFAQKFKLTLSDKGFLQTPAIEGFLQDRYIRLYESIEFNNVGKQVKRITAEVALKDRPLCNLVMMPRHQQQIFNTAQMPYVFQIDHENWDPTHLVGATDEEEARAYLTNNRLYELNKFFNMRGRIGFYVAGGEKSFLMLQFSHALEDPKRIHALFKGMFSLARALEQDTKLSPTKKAVPQSKKGEKETRQTKSDESQEAKKPDKS